MKIAILSFLLSFGIQAATATYQVMFEGVWSRRTHPTDFPRQPHFSPLVTLSHTSEYILGQVDTASSQGLEDLAETGSYDRFVGELRTLQQSFGVIDDISITPTFNSPGKVYTTIKVSSEHPYVSMVSMLAPSPDWFVALRGVSLYRDGVFLPSFQAELGAYDAGTDSGQSYGSPDEETVPRGLIRSLEVPGGHTSSYAMVYFKKID